MPLSHPVLDQHQVIAWDMDQTLIGGPNSNFFRAYIKAHPEKRHHVVTFRDRRWAMEIWQELTNCGDFRAKDAIKSVESCPEIIHNCYMVEFRTPQFREPFIASLKLTRDQFNAHVQAFAYWKGLRASHIGATLLVDDMPEWCLPGCEAHGIAFLNALEPWNPR